VWKHLKQFLQNQWSQPSIQITPFHCYNLLGEYPSLVFRFSRLVLKLTHKAIFLKKNHHISIYSLGDMAFWTCMCKSVIAGQIAHLFYKNRLKPYFTIFFSETRLFWKIRHKTKLQKKNPIFWLCLLRVIEVTRRHKILTDHSCTPNLFWRLWGLESMFSYETTWVWKLIH